MLVRCPFQVFEALWENPHELHVDPHTLRITNEDYLRAEAAKGGLIVAPVFGLFYGVLLGPFLGVVGAWQSEEPGWSGALEGLAIWWALLSMMAGVVAAVMCPQVLKCGPKIGPPRWMYVASPLFAVLIVLNCVRALCRLPRQRRLCQELTRRGAVFGGDRHSSFLGIDFREGAFTDDDLKALRFFPDLDHLDLSGTRITDAGMAHVVRLRRLRLLDLSETAITDAAVPHLTRLTKLWSLSLHGTAVTDAAVENLRLALPRCTISR